MDGCAGSLKWAWRKGQLTIECTCPKKWKNHTHFLGDTLYPRGLLAQAAFNGQAHKPRIQSFLRVSVVFSTHFLGDTLYPRGLLAQAAFNGQAHRHRILSFLRVPVVFSTYFLGDTL